MAQAAKKPQTTYPEYLAVAEASPSKQEFFDGQIFAMSGGSVLHGILTARFIGVLYGQLGNGPCRAGSSDVRIFLPHLGQAAYPDLSVICGRPAYDPRDPQGLTNPVVVVEVLSPTSESWDRGGKFERYAGLASLKDYILVTQDHDRIEHFARNADGTWTYRDLHAGEVLRLTGVTAEVRVDDLFVGVEELREPDVPVAGG